MSSSARDALADIGVLVTRPAHQADELVGAIESAGGRAYRFPVIDIVPRDAEETAREAAALDTPDIVIYVSANAVRYGAHALTDTAATTAAIGPATAAALAQAGRAPDVVPADGYDSERLLATAALRDVDGKTVTIVRGQTGRELLADRLRQRGANVQYLSAYRLTPHRFPAAELERLERSWRDGDIDAVMVLSVASLDGLLGALPPYCRRALAAARLVGPGERVIQTALDRLPGANVVLAPGPGASDMVGALVDSLRKNHRTPEE